MICKFFDKIRFTITCLLMKYVTNQIINAIIVKYIYIFISFIYDKNIKTFNLFAPIVPHGYGGFPLRQPVYGTCYKLLFKSSVPYLVQWVGTFFKSIFSSTRWHYNLNFWIQNLSLIIALCIFVLVIVSAVWCLG